nr:flagellar basal body rod protein FlgB [Desulfocapsaceae bacterium]
MKIGQNSDQTMALLQKVLDLRADKEKVIASNIANSETPGYKPSRLNFEKQLQHALDKRSFSGQTTHQKHIPLGPSNLEQVRGIVTKEQDGVELG